MKPLEHFHRRRVLIAGVAGLGLVACAPKEAFKSIDITGANYARDFELPDTEGKLRRLADFKGKVVVLFFGYTQCPDVCPTSLSDLVRVKQLLGSKGDKLQAVFVTVDPARDKPEMLKGFAQAIIALRNNQSILAYHDRSDGGLLACLTEMAFASHCGISINVDLLCIDAQTEQDYGDAKNWASQVSGRRHEQTIRALFNEELGAVIQIERSKRDAVFATLREHGISQFSHVIAKPNTSDSIEIWRDAKCIYQDSRVHLQKLWQNTSYQIARLRDNPQCADSEYQSIDDTQDPGMQPKLTFDPSQNISALFGIQINVSAGNGRFFARA